MKRPFFIIAAMFLASFILVSHFSIRSFSDEPVVLTHDTPPVIIMFGTRTCKYCAIARAFFDQHQLHYTEHDIETSDKDMHMFRLLGGTGTPLIIVNGEIIHGFDERAIRSNL